MYTLKIVAILVFFTFIGPTFAKPSDEMRARAFFRKGLEANHSGNSLEALRWFNRAYRLAPLSSRPAILFNIAVIEDAKPYNCASARASFERFLKECADVCRDRKLGAEKLATLKVRCKVPITVTSSPSQARLFVNGIPKETTPTTIMELPGEVSITLKRVGHKTVSDRLVVVESKPMNLQFALEKQQQHGQFRLSNVDEGIDVTLDGQKIGKQALSGIPVPVGLHTLRIVDKGSSAEHTLRVTIKYGFVTTVDIQAQKKIFDGNRVSEPLHPTFWSSAALGAISAGIGVGVLVVRANAVEQLNKTQRPSLRMSLKNSIGAYENVALGAFSTAGVSAAVALVARLWPRLRSSPKTMSEHKQI